MQESDPPNRLNRALKAVLITALVAKILLVAGCTSGSAQATASPFSGSLPTPAKPADTLRLTEVPRTLQTGTPEPTRTPRPMPEAVPLPKPGDRVEEGDLSCLYVNLDHPGEYHQGESSLTVSHNNDRGEISMLIRHGIVGVRGTTGGHILTYRERDRIAYTVKGKEVQNLALLCDFKDSIPNELGQLLVYKLEEFLPDFTGEQVF